jgi:hypothetical protein
MEQLASVGPRDAAFEGGEGRNRHFVDELAQKGRLGEDFDVDEGRLRLQGDRLQGRAAVDPAGRVNVQDRHAEDPALRSCLQPATGTRDPRRRTPADDVIGLIDRVQKRR